MKENGEEPNYILCIRKADSQRVSEGSTLTNCCECDEPVWISPASVEVLLDRDAKPICLQCATDKPGAGVHPPTPGQLKEIIKELKKELKIEDPTNWFKKQGGR